MTADQGGGDWSDERERPLHRPRVQAEAEPLRREARRSDDGKPSWQRFLESTGGAALVTVLLGGVLGNWIAGALAERRAVNERMYLTHQEYLEARLATIRPTLERIGHTVAAAEDLITITRPDFDPRKYAEGPDRNATLAKRRQIREAYNAADAEWRREKETLGYLLVYYHSDGRGVAGSWNQLEDAVTGFVDCARRWWVEHKGEPTEDAASACGPERAGVNQAMIELIGYVDMSRAVGGNDPAP